ncbi:E3 ubiquitin-protein ligase RAD18 [Triplophysa rosa]|uniref:RING-type E3 ubiquitin transferase n=1 Tax=Triplophysa rosa TaxID=992332 RepID=A0A9W7WS24_TRIRA|nr:E3 ubiquitin-protein ligase RAD18 [Triplophysa rosa]KAI7807279.1 E3 ubiquitin-protein ligase RAD18 [Triplophysa rosa]
MAQLSEVDLPPKLSCLKNMDTLLRCPICFEFLNISMMTSCSHNFCSLCIRKFLSYKLLCPVCNVPTTAQALRNNRLLDDLVQSFQAARQQLCQTNFETPPISPDEGKAARQRGLKKEAGTLSQFFQKKTPTTPLSKVQTSLECHFSLKEEPLEVCVQQPVRCKQKNVEETITKMNEEKMDVPDLPSTSQYIKTVVKVECPVCGVGVSRQHINKHLDMCLNRDDKKEGLRSGGRRKAMPKLLYTLISVPKLKKMLKECHLSTQGNRDQLVRRHHDFSQIYNAQCDSLNPKSAEDIAKEIESNERLRNQLDSKRKPAIVTTKNQTAEEIEELHSVYRKQHSCEFSCLIAQVKGRLETSKKTPIKQEDGKSADETVSEAAHSVQNTVQPHASTVQKVKSEVKNDVMELSSRSPSPAIRDVSLHRGVESDLIPQKSRTAAYRKRSSLPPGP